MIAWLNRKLSNAELEKLTNVAPGVPTSRILDEFGFPIPTEPKAEISLEDLELTKRFLKDAQDKTLSRSIHRVLGDLLGRLP